MDDEYIKTSIYVRKSVWEQFKTYVLNTHGSLKGYLGKEVSEALGSYLRSAHTHKNFGKNLFIKNVRRKHIDLLAHIAKNYSLEISRAYLLELITKLCGIDSRTKQKYMSFLIDHGFIVYDRGRGNNVIYKVNTERINAFLKEYGINIEEAATKQEIATYARMRYEAGDTLEEIKDKIDDLGVGLSKKVIRDLIRRGGKDDISRS